MMECIVFLAALLLIAVSYKVGTGEWFQADAAQPRPPAPESKPNGAPDEPSTVATAIRRIVE